MSLLGLEKLKSLQSLDIDINQPFSIPDIRGLKQLTALDSY